MENKNVFEKMPKNQINVEELKQTFQQMINEIKIENSKQNSVLKEIIEQKNEKIICLENKVKQMEESTCKKFGELNCYNGQNLEDGRKIGDYNIREKSIIDMLPTMIC
uniref:Ubiquitin-like domain-containing protein n=1 Tax=Meloidogyne javanica TaxID=6303 RepID=A0A915LSR9_MELJA